MPWTNPFSPCPCKVILAVTKTVDGPSDHSQKLLDGSFWPCPCKVIWAGKAVGWFSYLGGRCLALSNTLAPFFPVGYSQAQRAREGGGGGSTPPSWHFARTNSFGPKKKKKLDQKPSIWKDGKGGLDPTTHWISGIPVQPCRDLLKCH